MEATNVKAAPEEPLSITPESNHNALQTAIKWAVCILALRGILPPDAATRMLRRWGLADV